MLRANGPTAPRSRPARGNRIPGLESSTDFVRAKMSLTSSAVSRLTDVVRVSRLTEFVREDVAAAAAAAARRFRGARILRGVFVCPRNIHVAPRGGAAIRPAKTAGPRPSGELVPLDCRRPSTGSRRRRGTRPLGESRRSLSTHIKSISKAPRRLGGTAQAVYGRRRPVEHRARAGPDHRAGPRGERQPDARPPEAAPQRVGLPVRRRRELPQTRVGTGLSNARHDRARRRRAVFRQRRGHRAPRVQQDRAARAAPHLRDPVAALGRDLEFRRVFFVREVLVRFRRSRRGRRRVRAESS